MDMSEKHFVSTIKLSLASQTPMYMQLANYFKKQIKAGKIKPKDKLISEMDISRLLGISRTTVRLAFDYLEKEGFIVRKKSKGSFVAEQSSKRTIGTLFNLYENICDKKILVLQNSIQKANEFYKEKLKLTDEQDIIFVREQIIYNGETPIMQETVCVPICLCDGIENVEMIENSIHRTIKEKYGIKIEKTEETINVISINENIAHNLQCTPNTIGYGIECLAKLKNGTPCEYITSTVNAEKCKIKIISEKSKNDSVNFEIE